MVKMPDSLLKSSEIISHLFADNAHSKFAEKMEPLINQAIQSTEQNFGVIATKNQPTSADQ
jgi:hypothetical protein